MMDETLETEIKIFEILFPPDGRIPADRIADISRMRSFIGQLIEMSRSRRRTDGKLNISREENEKLNQRIAELVEASEREGKRLSWSEIAHRIGGGLTEFGARNRYRTWKRKNSMSQPGMEKSPAAPNPSDPATAAKAKPKNIKIPHEFDATILDLKHRGMLFTEIAKELEKMGIENCKADTVRSRFYSLMTTPPEDLDNPEPKYLSRTELDERIWKEFQDGMTIQEISDRLCAEGYYFGPKTITSRLRAQGADI